MGMEGEGATLSVLLLGLLLRTKRQWGGGRGRAGSAAVRHVRRDATWAPWLRVGKGNTARSACTKASGEIGYETGTAGETEEGQ